MILEQYSYNLHHHHHGRSRKRDKYMLIQLLLLIICPISMSLSNSDSSSSSSSGFGFGVVTGQGENLPNEIPQERGMRKSGSCATAGICCSGRDSSCVVQKAQPNAIPLDINDVPCYCDHACLTIGDCCPDFKQACHSKLNVQDCEVSPWTSWSDCDADCGLGVMTRTRKIMQDQRNGGQPCPALIQKRGCRGTKCQKIQSRITLEDTAIILPMEFSSKRKLNASSDITKNLRLRYPKNPDKEKSKPYCVEFEVIRSSRTCKHLESFAHLRQGNRICAMCEREAQRPYLNYKCAGSGGVDSSSGRSPITRFSSLRNPSCHGKWIHIRSDYICSCHTGAQYIFI